MNNILNYRQRIRLSVESTLRGPGTSHAIVLGFLLMTRNRTIHGTFRDFDHRRQRVSPLVSCPLFHWELISWRVFVYPFDRNISIEVSIPFVPVLRPRIKIAGVTIEPATIDKHVQRQKWSPMVRSRLKNLREDIARAIDRKRTESVNRISSLSRNKRMIGACKLPLRSCDEQSSRFESLEPSRIPMARMSAGRK